jgi:hypothetical protein
MMINNINKKEDNIVNINTTTSTPLTPEQRRKAEAVDRNNKRMKTLAKFVRPLAEAVREKNIELKGQHILAPQGEDEWVPKKMNVEYLQESGTRHPIVELSMQHYDKSYQKNEKGDYDWKLRKIVILFTMGKDINTWSYYGRKVDLNYVKMHGSWSRPERSNRYYKNMDNAVKKAIEAMLEAYDAYNLPVHYHNRMLDHNKSFKESIRLPEIDGINIKSGFYESGSVDHQTKRCLLDKDEKQSYNWNTATRTTLNPTSVKLQKHGQSVANRNDLTTRFSGFTIKTNSMEAGQKATTEAINEFNALLDKYEHLLTHLGGA